MNVCKAHGEPGIEGVIELQKQHAEAEGGAHRDSPQPHNMPCGTLFLRDFDSAQRQGF